MKEESAVRPNHFVLGEDTARRVLARAIELDHLTSAGIGAADLREAAGEVGISPMAFDAALSESITEMSRQSSQLVGQQPSERRLGWRDVWETARSVIRARRRAAGPEGTAMTTRWWKTLLTNVMVAPIAWVAMIATVLLLPGTSSAAIELGAIVAFGAGILVARRLHARIVELMLIAAAVMGTSQLLVHLLYGVRQAQGAATYMSLFITGVTCLMIGRRLGRTTPATPHSAHQSMLVVLPQMGDNANHTESTPAVPTPPALLLVRAA